MTTLSNSPAATLRRRIDLLQDIEKAGEILTPKPAEWWASMYRAAEELERRIKFETEGEAAYLAAIVDNRRLRGAMTELWESYSARLGPMERERELRALKKIYNAMKQPDSGRRIFGIEILEDQTREDVEADIVRVLDKAFAPPAAEEVAGEEDPAAAAGTAPAAE
jgi:hypothetical protein